MSRPQGEILPSDVSPLMLGAKKDRSLTRALESARRAEDANRARLRELEERQWQADTIRSLEQAGWTIRTDLKEVPNWQEEGKNFVDPPNLAEGTQVQFVRVSGFDPPLIVMGLSGPNGLPRLPGQCKVFTTDLDDRNKERLSYLPKPNPPMGMSGASYRSWHPHYWHSVIYRVYEEAPGIRVWKAQHKLTGV